jgi:hypothetical protein
MFLGATSLSSGGLALGSDIGIFFARYRRLLSDEAAGKSVWCVKGAAGIKPCMDCKNVICKAADGLSLTTFDDGDYLVDISCSDASRFDPMDPDALWHSHDVLAALKASGQMTRLAFEQVEKATGVSYEPEGLLADLELRRIAAPSSYARDPMHTMIAGGVVNVEIFLLLKAISSCIPGFKYETLRNFCGAAWLFPKCRPPGRLRDVFSEVRETSSLAAQIFKAGASEILSIYPLIRYFLEVTIMPRGSFQLKRHRFLQYAECLT